LFVQAPYRPMTILKPRGRFEAISMARLVAPTGGSRCEAEGQARRGVQDWLLPMTLNSRMLAKRGHLSFEDGWVERPLHCRYRPLNTAALVSL
jgi:hypothetical protein